MPWLCVAVCVMARIKSCALPEGALLGRYRRNGQYTDCYVAKVPGTVALPGFVVAFYTTPVFRLERLILKRAFARPSSDAEAAQLAAGSSERFAAWQVESRGEQQLLLADFRGRTRSWFMVTPADSPRGKSTALYFGSAVLPGRNTQGGAPGPGFRALLAFHRLYSVVLLRAAQRRLASSRGQEGSDR